MASPLGKHAIVIGAGIAGLAAAKALSAHFEKVTVLERDLLPAGPEARTGTPHCRQAHTLLKAGLNALLQFFPEFETELELAGAVRARAAIDILVETPGFDPWPRRDFGFDTLCMTRPLVESVARRLVERQGNIALLPQCRVRRLAHSADKSSVSGVYHDEANGQPCRLDADIVIDASSRGNLTLDALHELGLPRPAETEIGVDIGYATAIFDIPPGASREWRGIIHRPDAQSGRGAFLFSVENNRWQISLSGMHGDHPPDDLQGFVAFAKTLRTPTVYEAIKDATMVGVIHRFVFPCSVRRRFEALATFPKGLVPVGDVICRFNPAFGQGMTVAVQQVSVLKTLLDERAGNALPLNDVAPAFFTAIQGVLAAPWGVAESDFMYAKTRGERPVDFQQRLKFGSMLQRVAIEDAAVHKVLTAVNHLLIPPTALREPHIVEKVNALMAVSN
ncbi:MULTISPECIES: FAD-dependent oxidoreductase [Bradyrhizobium]|jgi:2-polyprenyl-6-methoxyphenol hydroxylase-like FAD-dependent oxidoreductase|uniref:FAD-dependent oxidoreductase n=2 Tax=Nitrobacteraceae TaxID=41294 RepID=UPI00155503E7|nr:MULTISPECIES: FAD-dependent oxidoreductase [unclassified Bradyrhizobium]MDU1493639.1 NAD(P)-binding protein [Bradyrhizobium sp.]MDU1544068.1 NAD(P)-binding protein [Bradyrhizobium sp.]MDU1801881.1 NAD(P)-binding protein [Bradyrhizobium sp.]MDU2924239.1 NAD(P)-binding protein [Bradyrhizobium sp.]MDU3093956.1 NAD(P)-binding protein [Bradyrhizobium sp.]